jgi:hypothetical protein
MARARMIFKSLGGSHKFARLRTDYPDIGLFAQALYPLIVVSSDDFGRQKGDAFSVKFAAWPAAVEDEDTFQRALDALTAVELITCYEVNGQTYLQVCDFDAHQPGLHKRTSSHIPEPPGNSGKFPGIPGNSNSQERERKKESSKERKKEKGTEQNRTGTEQKVSQEIPGNSRKEPEALKRALPGDARFERFWVSYPNKKGKDEARKAWDKRHPSETLTDLIVAAVEQQKTWPEWTKDGGRFIPHPATWLNRGSWEDEPSGHAMTVSDTTQANLRARASLLARVGRES